ncbi:hypothetical protein ANCCAN_11478 [Ancylostoma caninum]|uniref:7TM GPCR serpentine receptor class x (Srx) domain-containing protein n=1 Tax=Ancylostoma caninum TaxID=29170 RepID=A0A368GI06_ANCCA|nr:hypothetical protein ANCCAN_11478 [Ancylostoma caninum]
MRNSHTVINATKSEQCIFLFRNYTILITESFTGRLVGQLTLLFWYAAVYGQLQIAINGLLAIVSPVLYSRAFSIRRTAQIVAASWFLSSVHVIVFFWDECGFMFDVERLVWYYSESKCGEFLSFYFDFIHGSTICIAVVLMDVITFFAIFRHTKVNHFVLHGRAKTQAFLGLGIAT